MCANNLLSVPHSSFQAKVGPLGRISDMTITVARIDPDKLDSNRVTISMGDGVGGKRVANDINHLRGIFVYQDDKNVVGLVRPDEFSQVERPYPVTFYRDATAFSLKVLSSSSARTAVLDYASTFPASETENSPCNHYLDVFLAGIKIYIRDVNAGRISSPLNDIVIALDEAAYALWQGDAHELISAHLRFDSPTKRRLQHERQLLEGVRLNLGTKDTWLPHLTTGGQNHTSAVKKAIVAYLSQNSNARKEIESWPEFDEMFYDGNYFRILEERAMRDWDGLMNLFPGHNLSAATLLDYVQMTTDCLSTASAINDRLLDLAMTDPG